MKGDTIAAISTAYGEAGIGVIRISGEEARDIALRVFVPAAKERAALKEGLSASLIPRYMHYGHICDPLDGRVLDEALCVYMPGPHSYTGEDVVEIQCHSSLMSLREILALLLRCGAEPAERGEFTKRAFLNGRLDLAQAEAVMDLISARSSAGYGLALSQMQGSLSSRISAIRAELLEELVSMSVNMDYPDEDIEEVMYDDLRKRLSAINDELLELLASAEEGKIMREGVKIALIGRPNVGKSSLLNRFLREERSIVTDIPGTTRDTVEESASLRGISVSFVDTAGIRHSEDRVEMLGIERSKAAMDSADLVLLILDGSSEPGPEDEELLSLCRGRRRIIVINKSDAGLVTEPENGLYDGSPAAVISASTGDGMKELEDAIEGVLLGEDFRRSEDVLLSSTRHIELVRRAQGEIAQAAEQTELAAALDFIEINVHAAFDLLGEITGETAGDEIINEVFARFCLGK